MQQEALDHFLYTIKQLSKANRISLAKNDATRDGKSAKKAANAARDRDLLEKVAREEAKTLFGLKD